ncbi:MAG: hypothetical protein WC277_10970 [Bacilli bacterium]
MSWFSKKPLAEFSDEEIAKEFREREKRIRKEEEIAKNIRFGKDVIDYANMERVTIRLIDEECTSYAAVWKVRFDSSGLR